VYPEFAGLKPAMVAETTDFVYHLVSKGNRSLQDLLGADWTVTESSDLAALYGASAGSTTDNRILLPTRRGILNQGAFLSVYAHASETAPVLRGVAALRRVACVTIKSPTELNIQVVPPQPDPHVTNRQRFATHATDSLCASCHDSIDSFGFSFEQYDGMGNFQTTDNDMNIPIDSSVNVAVGLDFDGPYADSNALATALSNSAAVRECFARQIFRASSGRSDSGAQASEDAFVDYWRTLEMAAAAKGNIVNTILDYATNPAFIYRSPTP
jgi:hypothetical protein